MKWKPDWPQGRENFVKWWNGKGLVLWLTAPRDEPIEPIAEPEFAETTVWYEPCIGDPEACGAIRFEAGGNRWLDVHLALIDEALRRCDGRYLVGVPDLLDGEDAIQHLDALLEIDSLGAIEWTPRMLYTGDAEEAGGSKKWWGLYRRIRDGGKSVQAIGVRPAQVAPLLDALGPEGMYLSVGAPDEAAAEKLLKDAEPFR